MGDPVGRPWRCTTPRLVRSSSRRITASRSWVVVAAQAGATGRSDAPARSAGDEAGPAPGRVRAAPGSEVVLLLLVPEVRLPRRTRHRRTAPGRRTLRPQRLEGPSSSSPASSSRLGARRGAPPRRRRCRPRRCSAGRARGRARPPSRSRAEQHRDRRHEDGGRLAALPRPYETADGLGEEERRRDGGRVHPDREPGTSTPSETIRTATIQREPSSLNSSILFEAAFSSESTTVAFSPGSPGSASWRRRAPIPGRSR